LPVKFRQASPPVGIHSVRSSGGQGCPSRLDSQDGPPTMGQPYVNFALIRAVAGLKLAPPRLVASTRASTHASDNGIILERRFDSRKVGSAKKSVLNVAQNVCRRGKTEEKGTNLAVLRAGFSKPGKDEAA